MSRRLIGCILWILLLTPRLAGGARAAGDPQALPAGAEVPAQSTPKPETGAKAARKPDLRPKPPEPVADTEITVAIERGVDFLLKDQNAGGSWGSPERTKDLNIIAGIGSHHAYRTAVTALCVSALIEVSNPGNKLSNPAAVVRAIERGEEFLFRELPLVRRDEPMLIYNVWAHAYGIQALVRMHQRQPRDKARRARIEELIRGQYDRLARYESVEGGWGYLDFGAGTQRPNSYSCSFVNATVLVAFHEARQIGVLPPEKLVQRGMQGIVQQRNPDFSYLYGLYLRYRPAMAINRPGGSLGRSQACNVALRLWGDRKVTDGVLTEWLDRLIVRNGWLDMGRKRPIPHESHFMVAGYFYYYGHYYATLCVAQLPQAERPFYQDHLARILLGHQERDGSWWDYPLYNYHQQYGTAFALMSLEQCRKQYSSPSEPQIGRD
ncbi:MAG: prenyltransferase/squalene oxidase repeat-containing protein [Isosphaerales bacterium]